MAAQNRKSSDERAWRQKAKDAVDHYLEVIYAEVRNRDIAWESRSVIGMAADFHGEIPKGSGFSGFCKLGAKVDRMAHDVRTQDHHSAVDWMKSLPVMLCEALVYDRALRGRERVLAIDPLQPGNPITKVWTDEICAADLDCSRDTFRRRVSDGYFELEKIMGFRLRHAA